MSTTTTSRRRLSWERIFSTAARVGVWALLLALLYLLRSFFLLIFLTFIFAYVQEQGVRRTERFIERRSLRVVLVGITLLGLLVLLFGFLFPRVKHQAEIFASRSTEYVRLVDEELLELRESHRVWEFVIPAPEAFTGRQLPEPGSGTWRPSNSPTALVLQKILGGEGREPSAAIRDIFEVARHVGSVLLAIISAFFLSLLFSFLIVLDLPNLTRQVKGLRETKLAFVYEEVAPGIRNFGTTMGRTFGAQGVIALVNTVLTSFALLFLGLEQHIAFLLVIVFFCGFIPVAGVFLSSLPICLLALQESGVQAVLGAILLIWLIHMMEAYVLNPRIFGSRLHINPVLVLIILTVGGKLFGVWGLLLGLPVCKYLFSYAIQYHDESEYQE